MDKTNFYVGISEKPINPQGIKIYGMVRPQIIIQEGRSFTAIKETINSDDEKNLALIFKPTSDGQNKEYTIRNNIKYKINQLGGDDYYAKYLKYKNKYIALKKKILLQNE